MTSSAPSPADLGPTDVTLLDSGHGRKLERFGRYILARPCAQAVWEPRLPARDWDAADASFDREDGLRWHGRAALPECWDVSVDGQRFRLAGTDFGHLGIFPEQRAQWRWIREHVAARRRATGEAPSLLNLFAYSGGSTVAAALAGAAVCHLDASRGMVDWAHENARLNGLSEAPVRWIPEDAHKFLRRELRRGRRYDAIVLDPPTFGRGKSGETYKIERDLPETLRLCRELLSDHPLLVLLSAHTPGLTPVVLANLLSQALQGTHPRLESGEMLLTGNEGVLPLPSGAYARASFPL